MQQPKQNRTRLVAQNTHIGGWIQSCLGNVWCHHILTTMTMFKLDQAYTHRRMDHHGKGICELVQIQQLQLPILHLWEKQMRFIIIQQLHPMWWTWVHFWGIWYKYTWRLILLSSKRKNEKQSHLQANSTVVTNIYVIFTQFYITKIHLLNKIVQIETGTVRSPHLKNKHTEAVEEYVVLAEMPKWVIAVIPSDRYSESSMPPHLQWRGGGI